MVLYWIFVVLNVVQVRGVAIDPVHCGVDNDLDVHEGNVDIEQYPWLGVLYYSYDGEEGEARAVSTVALIHAEFVIAPAADIQPMPKDDFRSRTRVLLGEDWSRDGRRVRNYVLHPEHDETRNTVALVQLATTVRDVKIRPLCPPPERLRNPEFYVVRFAEDYNNLQKQVIPVAYVPANLCKEFYVRANLYARRMRPPHVACAMSLEDRVCVWDAGGALVARDHWGRWQLLGVGVRGPGCGAPSRYLDMMSYYPWVEASLDKFRRITISKLSQQKYVLRTGQVYQRFGNCDEEEKTNLLYRERIRLVTDNHLYQFLTYNMTIKENVEFTCLTLELVNASAVSEMRVHHYCRRESRGPPCYYYQGTVFEISVYLMFSDSCLFDMVSWGFKKSLKLLDIQEWKWEEGTYYEDFSMTPEEYRGPAYQTEFGFEPLDLGMWVPDFDVWATTPGPADLTTKIQQATAGTPPPMADWAHLPAYTETWTTPPTSSPEWVDYMGGQPNVLRTTTETTPTSSPTTTPTDTTTPINVTAASGNV